MDFKYFYQLANAVGVLRNAFWLALSFVLYGLAMCLADYDALSKVQIILWKVGHVNIAAFVGYWLDRTVFQDRIHYETPLILHIRRAVMIVGAMVSVSLGM